MMNKIFTLSLIFIAGLQTINAQEYVEVAIGASYSNQAYYTLSDNAITTIDNQSWDIAFTTGFSEAGILINESTDASFTGPAPELKLYITYVEDFSSTIDASLLTDSLYNDEANWQSGAFNRIASTENPFDFGWGTYNPINHTVEGTWVYALKLRDESWKKIKIESLSGGVYTMKYADLDGANEQTVTITQADFDGPMAYFSFETEVVTASPTNWDLVFQRYLSPIPAGAGGAVIDYPTTGVLNRNGIEIAEAREVNPAEVEYEAHVGDLSTENNVIGYDWKSYDLSVNQWVIADDLTYFVKMEDDRVWKLTFVDFEGASTGNMTFEKTDLGVITAVTNPNSNFKEAGVFPNPIIDQFTVTFSLEEARNNMELFLVNTLGQTVWKGNTSGDAGLNVLNVQAPNVPAGYYQLVVGNGGDLWTTSVILK